MKRSSPSQPSLEFTEGFERLKSLQRDVSAALFRPLAPGDRMQRRWTDGRLMRSVAAEWIKPNDRLTSFERLEIYNRCYWFRVLDCLYDDFPALRMLLGQRKFHRLITDYLAQFPSASFTLRDLGSRLEGFLRNAPAYLAPHEALGIDLVRLEWAQITAFDDPALPPLKPNALASADSTTLRLALQPHIVLLDLSHPAEQFALAVKRANSRADREQASNVVEFAPKPSRKRRPKLPPSEPTFLAVHRFENSVYFKRLEPAVFELLRALRDHATVNEACEAGFRRFTGTPEEFSGVVRDAFQNFASLGWFRAHQPARRS